MPRVRRAASKRRRGFVDSAADHPTCFDATRTHPVGRNIPIRCDLAMHFFGAGFLCGPGRRMHGAAAEVPAASDDNGADARDPLLTIEREFREKHCLLLASYKRAMSQLGRKRRSVAGPSGHSAAPYVHRRLPKWTGLLCLDAADVSFEWKPPFDVESRLSGVGLNLLVRSVPSKVAAAQF